VDELIKLEYDWEEMEKAMHGSTSLSKQSVRRIADNTNLSSISDILCTEYLCWTRMQVEAGQALETIVGRKEVERQAGNGLFFWGVGNAPSTAINALARLGIAIPLIFSVMKSKPKAMDVAPSRIVAWTAFIDRYGKKRLLPNHAVVTSRGDSPSRVKTHHYALMCHSDQPLRISRGTPFHVDAYRNASASGGKVGASQVTALLKPTGECVGDAGYEINLSASLTDSYWVKLVDPVEVSRSKLTMLDQADGLQPKCWNKLAQEIKAGQPKKTEYGRLEERLLI